MYVRIIKSEVESYMQQSEKDSILYFIQYQKEQQARKQLRQALIYYEDNYSITDEDEDDVNYNID